MHLAQYAQAYIRIPTLCLTEEDRNRWDIEDSEGVQYGTIPCNNTERDVVDVESTGFFTWNKYGPSYFWPILPGLRRKLRQVELSPNFSSSLTEPHYILWSVVADNAPVRSGRVALADVSIADSREVNGENE